MSLNGVPTMEDLPSLESATEVPKLSPAAPSAAVSRCCVQTPPARVKTCADPWVWFGPTLSRKAPTIAVFPSLESATDLPNQPPAAPPVAVSCSWFQTPPRRVKTYAEP